MIDSAIILAAGLGTRLAPLSAVRAKAALPVAGESIIRRQLRWLAAAGVRRAVVNLHHRPATVAAVVGHGDDLGVEVRYSWEPRILGSGGGPRQAFDVLGAERCVIVNGDTLTDLDLTALCADHERTGALVTMAAVVGDLRRYNAVLVDANGALTGFASAGTSSSAMQRLGVSAAHFIGIQVAERRTFDGVSLETPSETVKEIYPAILERRAGALRVWTSDATFHDVGTPADYHRTVATFAAQEGREFDRGPNVVIDPTATLTRVVCWNRVRVDAGARLVDCVLADDVRVPAGLQLQRASVVLLEDRTPAPGDRVVGNTVVVPFEPAAPLDGAGRE